MTVTPIARCDHMTVPVLNPAPVVSECMMWFTVTMYDLHLSRYDLIKLLPIIQC